MNLKNIFHILGIFVFLIGAAMLPAFVIAAALHEAAWRAIGLASLVTMGAGLLMYIFIPRTGERISLTHREGFVIVTLAWVLASAFGALPFLFSGAVPTYCDAFFETISGFTTTGASVMSDLDRVSRGIHFWRALTQWLGGMGIIILSIAILPLLGVGGMQLFKAEIPSPVTNGTVQPVLSVRVGSFVSGPIKALHVDFNSEVKKDDLLAEIDPQLYEAAVARDEAYLATQQAQVARTRATLQQAINDEKRAEAFRARNKSYVSEAEMDRLRFSREATEAELALAEASVRQAEASLRNSRANLGYTKIRSPVDGTVIDRKIDPGQTLAAQFQTPEMFIVAPDMEKKMHVLALVDEADIGLIRAAKDRNEEVEFTVDAYPDELFKGKIYQVRVSPNTLQNVVTYTVVVEAPNPGRKLLPGMTAELTFQVEKKSDVVKIPNAALRFYPKLEQVREVDRKILEGEEEEKKEEDESNSEEEPPAAERIKIGKEHNKRHVWVVDGDFLRAVRVTTGIDDYRYTELVSGDLKPGMKLVTGEEVKE